MKNGIRLFGHPLHPMLTDFPIALWSISLLWDVVYLWRGDAFWWRFALWSLGAGLIVALLAAITGLLDYATLSQEHPATQTATQHMVVMLIATIFFVGSLAVHARFPSPTRSQMLIALALSGLGLVALVIGGWLGGELVFHHNVGSR